MLQKQSKYWKWIEVVPPALFETVFHNISAIGTQHKCPGRSIHATRPPTDCQAISAVWNRLWKVNLEIAHGVGRIPMGITRQLNQLPFAGLDLPVMTENRGYPAVFGTDRERLRAFLGR